MTAGNQAYCILSGLFQGPQGAQQSSSLTVSFRGLRNGPRKKESTTRRGMQKGANFCASFFFAIVVSYF